MMKRNLLIAMMSLAFVACTDKKEQENTEKLTVETTEVTANPTELLGKEWKLKELYGNKVVTDTTAAKQPHINFNDLVKASGNLGCNGFGAKVEFAGSNSIKISQIVSTKMACGSMETEVQFGEALRNATNYINSGTTLYLNNAENTTVAVLESDK
ncbi:Heat shock protein HslJ [Paenimyroides ummariense]|uniref:Heat shock protein HslJ n=1 Tax=Paenimyroides ummariense TaxID=913024 RepID=A0A1I4Z4F2_9FLAO|nr:META domain-containing protein [Paenimyroides ummariense]SFN45164.1 Heat shock protein HslJ [Paenimyroides ummariense]